MFCLQTIIHEKRRIYFLIKEDKHLIKYIEILEKLSNIIKHRLNIQLIHSKKCLKTVKDINKRETFNVYMHQ